MGLSRMRRILIALLAFAWVPAAAQPVPPPPQLEPIPEPPPQVGLDAEPATPGPTITAPGSKVETFTMPDGSQVIRVTDPNGWEYHLVEATPGAPLAGTVTGDFGNRAPMWTILQW
jgi:hypothetical protein